MKIHNSEMTLAQFRRAIAERDLGIYFGQSAEDAVLTNIFREKRGGFYIDVGCNDPVKYSNTFLLHHVFGWTGINIDADPDIIKRFARARPGDKCIFAAVSDVAEPVSLTIFKGKAHNTIDNDVKARKSNLEIDRVIDLTTVTLASILAENVPEGLAIDLLNVDVEGVDLKALRSFDWKRNPVHVVCVEDHDFRSNPAKTAIFEYLAGLNYKLHAHMIQTSIYVRR